MYMAIWMSLPKYTVGLEFDAFPLQPAFGTTTTTAGGGLFGSTAPTSTFGSTGFGQPAQQVWVHLILFSKKSGNIYLGRGRTFCSR